MRLGAGLAVLTGLVYGSLRYFGGVEGEFGPEPSPWLSLWQHAHVLVAPVLVFGFGVVMAGHARTLLAGPVGRGKRSGLGLALVAVPLVLGGYAIQVVMTASTRSMLGWLHAGLGVLFARRAQGLDASRHRVTQLVAPRVMELHDGHHHLKRQLSRDLLRVHAALVSGAGEN